MKLFHGLPLSDSRCNKCNKSLDISSDASMQVNSSFDKSNAIRYLYTKYLHRVYVICNKQTLHEHRKRFCKHKEAIMIFTWHIYITVIIIITTITIIK